MTKKLYPCDIEPYQCPFTCDGGSGALGTYFCRDYCGLGITEEKEEN